MRGDEDTHRLQNLPRLFPIESGKKDLNANEELEAADVYFIVVLETFNQYAYSMVIIFRILRKFMQA